MHTIGCFKAFDKICLLRLPLRYVLWAMLLCITIGFGATLAGCGVIPSQSSGSFVSGSIVPGKRNIIIDTDTGADDASALILAAMDPDVNIVGVTVLEGNVDLEQSTKNALMALELAGCDAPVYKGATSTLNGTRRDAVSVFGEDGIRTRVSHLNFQPHRFLEATLPKL